MVTPKFFDKVSPVPPKEIDLQFDIEGLMTDFPTAKDLERFVYEQTGYILNLKGRANAVSDVVKAVAEGEDEFVEVDGNDRG